MQPYAGFWLRFVAYIIDSILLQIVLGVLSAFLGMGAGLAGAGSDALIGVQLGSVSVMLVGQWLYFAFMESSTWQASLGKKALGLVVTDEHGERISFGRATGRYFGKILSSLILLIGYMMAGWTERKQALHDMLASTLVYKASSPELVRSSASVFE
jgi:uncharacterized RDD family membrane protein YckC